MPVYQQKLVILDTVIFHVRVEMFVTKKSNEKAIIPGGTKNVPNFRIALCDRVIKTNEVKSTYSVNRYFRISVNIFT